MFIFFLVVLLYDLETVWTAFADIFSISNAFDKNNIVPLITVSGTVFAYFSLTIVNYGDFTRYVKNENELKKGNLSLILNLLIFSFFAVFIVIGSDIFLNKNLENMERILTNPTDIVGKIGDIQITVIVLFFIIFASASTNLIANYIPTQNALLNFLPAKLNIKNDIGNGLPISYIFCTNPVYQSLESSREIVRQKKWPIFELNEGHDAMYTNPKETLNLLMKICN